MRSGNEVTYRWSETFMAKIRLINLRGGKKGWSVPYRFGEVNLRKVFPIIEGGNTKAENHESVKKALKAGLTMQATMKNVQGELGSVE